MLEITCKRCGHQWEFNGAGKTIRCSQCKWCKKLPRDRPTFEATIEVIPISNEAAAYLAGLLDGEGSIGVSGNPYPSLSVTICNTDKRAPEFALSQLRVGSIRETWSENSTKPLYVYSVAARKAASVLLTLRKWLVIKPEQADLGIAFQKEKMNRLVFRFSEEEKAKLDWYKKEFIRLRAGKTK